MRHADELELSGKKVVKRVDINLPLDAEGKPVENPRLRRHAESLKRLTGRGAKVIVLAHQGRKGKSDFLTLEGHAEMLRRHTGLEVRHIPHLSETKVAGEIEQMREGEVLLLENVRMWENEEEEIGGSPLLKVLSSKADAFLLGALSVAHRPHASVVGLTKHLPSASGYVLKSELDALGRMEGGEAVLVIGGGKVRDSLKIIAKWLAEGRASKVLVGGAVAALFLYALGKRTPETNEYLEETGATGHSAEARELLERYEDRIMIPVDVALNIEDERVEAPVSGMEKGGIYDIGEKTIEKYAEEILGAKKIFVNGPMGVYEKEGFGLGTKRVLEAIAESDAYSLVGGGHTITAIEQFGVPEKKFGYVSLSGKALIEYLSGKELPGLKALKENRLSL